MNARLTHCFGERMPMTRSLPREEGVGSSPELRLEDARSVRDGLWRMAQLVRDAAETLHAGIDDEDPDGEAEALEVWEVLERVQALSLEVSRSWTPARTGTLDG
jgi:hypothetical protein